jgi:transposase InsO family protein
MDAASTDHCQRRSARGAADRGANRWPGWLSRIAEAKLVRSMSRKGCSPDNAACEGFFGRLKTEMFFSRDWLSTPSRSRRCGARISAGKRRAD